MPTYLYIFIKISGILKSTYKPILFLKIYYCQAGLHTPFSPALGKQMQ